MIESVAAQIASLECPVVIDPVMISKHGDSLLEDNAIDAMKNLLFQHAFLVTPNLLEATRLSGIQIEDLSGYVQAAEKNCPAWPKNVLIKGQTSDKNAMIDLLWVKGEAIWFRKPRVITTATHGSGCVYSAAITAKLALGKELKTAVSQAKEFVHRAINTGIRLGKGIGPVNMHASIQEDARESE